MVASGIRLGLPEDGRRRGAVLAVVVRDRGVRRQVERVRAVVALLLEVDRRQVEDAADEDQPVEVHPVALLEVRGQRGPAERPVGLARDELRRHPALVARGPEPDQLADVLDVPLVAVVVPRLAALDRAGPAGRHRVDEDQVADREQGLRVVDEVVRRRREAPASPMTTRRGPRRPRWSQTLELPGPPLKAKTTGRVRGRRRRGCRSSSRSRPRALFPANVPSLCSSSRSTTRPAVAVYLSRRRPTRSMWCVVTRSSFGSAAPACRRRPWHPWPRSRFGLGRRAPSPSGPVVSSHQRSVKGRPQHVAVGVEYRLAGVAARVEDKPVGVVDALLVRDLGRAGRGQRGPPGRRPPAPRWSARAASARRARAPAQPG